MEQLALSIPDMAKSLGIGRSTLCELIKEGRGPRVVKIGRRSLIRVEDAKEWLRELGK